MHQSSDSIAQLAAALAKAQLELVNPQKTLTGTIDSWGNGGEGQSYRYAPLSAGLEIVRKALCKHELAVIQTTHVDQRTDVLMLTTTLAHGSGEFICASWPVCRTADLTNPKTMGSALTYARRYGLFTLVGIAGEDDLDAQDVVQFGATPMGGMPQPLTPEKEQSASEVLQAHPTRRKRSDAGVPRGPRPQQAGSLQQSLAELAVIEDQETLFKWALKALPLRNGLSDEERRTVDSAFMAKAQNFGAEEISNVLAVSESGKPNGFHYQPQG